MKKVLKSPGKGDSALSAKCKVQKASAKSKCKKIKRKKIKVKGDEEMLTSIKIERGCEDESCFGCSNLDECQALARESQEPKACECLECEACVIPF